MSEAEPPPNRHSTATSFLGEGHEKSERRTWAVIWLCGAMMLAEIVGGWLFGSIALVADGLHMSTHAGALLLAALAYTFARRYAERSPLHLRHRQARRSRRLHQRDHPGDDRAAHRLRGRLSRLFAPVPIHFAEAIPIACLGLAVNIASAWLLSGGDHPGHGHGARSSAVRLGHDHDETKRIATGTARWSSKCSRTAFRRASGCAPKPGGRSTAPAASVETVRPDGARQVFVFVGPRRLSGVGRRDSRAARFHGQRCDQRRDPCCRLRGTRACARRRGPRQQHARRVHPCDGRCRRLGDGDRRPRAWPALFGWLWMDPVAGIVGALVIASWSFALIRDTARSCST